MAEEKRIQGDIQSEDVTSSSSVAERQVVRKVDWRLLPILGALYTIALIDRNNISVARIAGLDKDLALKVGNRASIVLLIFFPGYILLEVPSNLLLRRARPSRWLSAIAVLWGIVSIGIGFVNTWEALAVLRAILGCFEAGFYPGCVYLIAAWYKRYELQKRLSIFFSVSLALSGFSNILALALIQVERVSSLAGWRWIFIIEGALTVVLGAAAYFIIVDFPSSPSNKFLTPEETEIIEQRLIQERGLNDTTARVTWRLVVATCLDLRVLSYGMMYFAGAAGIYAFAFFLPTILQQGFGFSQSLSFVLSAMPPIFAALVCILISRVADQYRARGVTIIGSAAFGIVGLCLTGFLKNAVARYIGTFLGYAAAVSLVVTSMAWMANNVRSDSERAVATAVMIGISGIGGIYSSLVFRQQDAPDYTPGLIAILAVNALSLLLAFVTRLILKRSNSRADKLGIELKSGDPTFRWTI